VPEAEFVLPQPPEIDIIHDTYDGLIKTRNGSPQQHRTMTAFAHTLMSRDKVDAIVFAGTDLTSLFDETNTDFPHLDCAALHLNAINRRLCSD
jgi:aspartate racemase